MSLRLLCIGDVHLGRRPSRLSGPLLERVDAARLGPAAALRLAVEHAVARSVDGVLLAGDVVEQADDFYEAYGDLERAVRDLAAAGIRVLAVAGNHDTQVLPRLADAMDGLQLLGRGGRWEAVTIAGADGGAARIAGWSFPEPRVHASPLDGFGAHAGAGGASDVALIGLLHCDRDQAGSPYAPVRGADLETAPVDAWLLGHVHQPDALDGDRPIGYLGSLSGLDPGEPGPRGPWELDIDGPGRIRATHLPLAPLRWERLTVAVDALHAPEEIDAAITRRIAELHAAIGVAGAAPLAVGCRLRIEGRTRLGSQLERHLGASDPRRLVLTHDQTTYFVEKVELGLRPAADLEQLAASPDPAGVLARRLLLLRRPATDPERRTLVGRAMRELDRTARSAVYAELGAPAPTEEAAAEYLEAAGMRALDALLEQREQIHGHTPDLAGGHASDGQGGESGPPA